MQCILVNLHELFDVALTHVELLCVVSELPSVNSKLHLVNVVVSDFLLFLLEHAGSDVLHPLSSSFVEFLLRDLRL